MFHNHLNKFYRDTRINFFDSFKKPFWLSNLVYLKEKSIRKAFIHVSFEKLYKLGQPYKLKQKVSNYFVPEYTPPSVRIIWYKYSRKFSWFLIRKELFQSTMDSREKLSNNFNNFVRVRDFSFTPGLCGNCVIQNLRVTLSHVESVLHCA